MAYILKTNYANPYNYGGKRQKKAIKFIVVHYTSNDGDTDESNANYFKRNKIKTSAHYFVDDNSVTISVADTNIAYSVGGKKWKDCAKTGGGKYYKKCTNANSLNIELCDTKRDGKYGVTEATMQNAAELIKKKMKEYNIPIQNVIRHFDVNGKHCPAYFCCSPANDLAWIKFKERLIEQKIDYSPIFNAVYYSNKYADLKKAFGTNKDLLLEHFKQFGMKEGRQACADFNVQAYKAKNPDLQKAFGEDLQKYYMHYIEFGRKEGRICL